MVVFTLKHMKEMRTDWKTINLIKHQFPQLLILSTQLHSMIFPFKNRTPKNLTTDHFEHPVSISCFLQWVVNFMWYAHHFKTWTWRWLITASGEITIIVDNSGMVPLFCDNNIIQGKLFCHTPLLMYMYFGCFPSFYNMREGHLE